jgi:uncharacterized protein YcbK (DUF882 family)
MAKDTRLSPNFTLGEFYCKDGTPPPPESVPAIREVCRYMLEPLREKYGSCTVLSGYRHENYNRRIGGARFSQHIYDQTPVSIAVDVRFRKGTPAQWARSMKWRRLAKSIWRRAKRGGVGLYVNAGFVHFDSGPRRDWTG